MLVSLWCPHERPAPMDAPLLCTNATVSTEYNPVDPAQHMSQSFTFAVIYSTPFAINRLQKLMNHVATQRVEYFSRTAYTHIKIAVGADGATYEKFADGTTKDITNELPFDLPQGWAWCRIRDVTILRRGEYVTKKLMGHGNIPVILGGQEPAYYCDRSNHDGPCVVISRSGASAGFASYWNQPIFVTDGFLFECPTGLTTRFVYHWFKSIPLVKLQRGTGMPHVQSENLNAMLFALPPSAEQIRIGAKIDELFAYADKIDDASERMATTTECIDKKILELAIRGQLVPQNPADEPASELVRRIEAAKTVGQSPRDCHMGGSHSRATAASDRPAYEIDPPFDIPDSWKWVRLGTLIHIIAGVSYQKDDVTTCGVRILRGGNIKEDARIYLHDDDVFLPATYADKNTSVKKGDIVVVASTGSSTVIGRPAVVAETMLGVQIGAFLRIVRAVDDSIRSWLPVIFLGDYYRNHVRSKSKGTNIKNLKAEYLTELHVPLPPLAEQKRIVAKIEELRAMTKVLTT